MNAHYIQVLDRLEKLVTQRIQMGSHVTFPKLRKTVHKVMRKYGKKRFYRKIDWIDKVLKKLEVRSTPNLKARIRNHINRWLVENSEILDTKTDSKKGILDSKSTAVATDNKDDSAEKKNEGNNSNNVKENQQQAQVQEQVDLAKPTSSNSSIPQMPEAISIKKLREKIAVIDLTSDDEKKVKKNVIEVITIDDDIEIIDEKILPQQPIITLPEQYFARPDYSYYDYSLNDYFFYPVIVQPHSANY